MKILFSSFIFLLVPAVLFLMLLYAVVPLFVQHFFRPKKAEATIVYPYLTSWEEAA